LAENEANEPKTWNIEHIPSLRANRLGTLAQIHQKLGILLYFAKNNDEAIVEYKKALVLCEESRSRELLGLVYLSLATTYANTQQYQLAQQSYLDAEKIFLRIHFLQYLGSVYVGLGDLYQNQHQDKLALQYFYKAVGAAIKGNNLNGVRRGCRFLSNYYLKVKQADSSLNYAIKTLNVSKLLGYKDLGDNYETLYKSYVLKNQLDSAYKYQGLALAAKDSSFDANSKSLADFQKLSFDEQLHSQQLEQEKADIESRNRTYFLSGAVGVLLLLSIVFYRNNRQKQKANVLLNEQKEEIQNTLTQLKTTQTQLIQSEKMASLGELTAGIAHEIQNPLNFVNNFSEVSVELLAELKEEEEKGNKTDVIAIADDLSQNLEKIRHHGKRAESIVKGMLEHSRTTSGQKEPTDINQLADEYLRMAYHGLKAKKQDFEAELITGFDERLPQANVVPQDIGRVLLNLFNNAFYAVNQKQKTAGADYKPEVSVSTSIENGFVTIKVKDNGTGIPDAIKEKILQPFFTTKPTGEGTGLGLSLSYDIIVKGHGGKIIIESKDAEGSEFIIVLPSN
jgi:signal transduction histidine kinase